MSGQQTIPPDPATICFGLSLELDRRSCAAYLQLLGRPELARTLCSRLSPEEIDRLVEALSGLMKTHLSKQEYHTLFLGEEHSPHPADDQ